MTVFAGQILSVIYLNHPTARLPRYGSRIEQMHPRTKVINAGKILTTGKYFSQAQPLLRETRTIILAKTKKLIIDNYK